jgi:hypothetical protein
MEATVKLLEAADEHDPDFGTVLRVLVATGARRGEVCGLRWSDIDFAGATITIRRSVASVAGGTVVKEPKTHAARRIAIDAATLRTLEQRREHAAALADACRLAFDRDGFVFTSEPDGSRPLHPDTITGGFQRLRERTGLSDVRLHDLRHLHATQLLAAGVPVRTVSGRLGHANAATTLNVYAHFLEASDRQAADVIAGLLEKSSQADVVRTWRSAKEIAGMKPPTDDSLVHGRSRITAMVSRSCPRRTAPTLPRTLRIRRGEITRRCWHWAAESSSRPLTSSGAMTISE